MRELLLVALLLAPIPVQLQTGVVTGQLSSKDGSVVSGIRVSVTPVAEPGASVANGAALVSSALTDSAGRFRLDNVAPGRYYVTAGLVQQPTYYPGVDSLSGATAVTVAAGATATGINFDIVASLGITVKGRVVRPAGVVAGNPQVIISGPASTTQPVSVGTDGAFVLTRVRPGAYSLNVLGVPDAQAQSVTFVAAEKDIEGIELVLVRTVAVSGSVAVEGGGLRPTFGLVFANFKGGGSSSPIGFFNNGSMRTQLPEGEYRVTWNLFPAGYVLKSLTAGSTDLLVNPFKISIASPPPPIVVTVGVASPPPWVRVSGRVAGAPRDSRTLGLSGGGLEALSATINPDGSFEFPTVLPGTYQARLFPAIPVSPFAVIVPNRALTDVQIVIPPLREMIPGRVVLEGGSTLFPVTLSFTVINPAGAPLSTLATTQTDATFKVTLPEGDHRLVLSAPGYVVKSATFGAMDMLKDPIKVSLTGTEEFRVTLASTALSPLSMMAPVEIPREIARIVDDPVSQRGTPTPDPPPTRVPESILTSSLAYRPEPAYPDEARRGRITGAVVLDVTVNRQGRVTDVRAVSGPAELRQAAIDAVKQWQYRPVTVNGAIVPVAGSVTVTFSLR